MRGMSPCSKVEFADMADTCMVDIREEVLTEEACYHKEAEAGSWGVAALRERG